MEVPQDHLVFYVVPGVLCSHILEQNNFLPHDLVRTGPQPLAATDHAPHPATLRQRDLERKEVFRHLLESLCRQICRDGLVAVVAVRRFQVCIELFSDKELCTSGPVDNLCD